MPLMTDGEGFTGTYLAQENSRDWLDQLPVHRPTRGHMLQVGQGIHPLHVREEDPPIVNLAKPFVIPISIESLEKKLGFLSRAQESDSNRPSEMISRRVSILALLIRLHHFFDLFVVTGVVFWRMKIMFGSAPPTCPK